MRRSGRRVHNWLGAPLIPSAITADLEAALEQFATIAEDLAKAGLVNR
jgi:hypothetical protein